MDYIIGYKILDIFFNVSKNIQKNFEIFQYLKINVIDHINKLNNKSHMIILILRKVLIKSQYPLLVSFLKFKRICMDQAPTTQSYTLKEKLFLLSQIPSPVSQRQSLLQFVLYPSKIYTLSSKLNICYTIHAKCSCLFT